MNKKDFLGWAGVALILSAYSLLTFGIIASDSLIYGVINFAGALGLIVSSFAKKDFQPVALNIIWLLIASVGIIKSIFSLI